MKFLNKTNSVGLEGKSSVKAGGAKVSSWSMAALMAALITVIVCASAPAKAVSYVGEDFGGSIRSYASHYINLRNEGEPLVIDGICASACTLFLGIIPPERVCATPNAMLGFHAARLRTAFNETISVEGTRDLMGYYPVNVRNWIARHGGLGEDFIFLHGRELSNYVRPCRSR